MLREIKGTYENGSKNLREHLEWELTAGAPEEKEGRLQKELAVYELLEALEIPFWRIDHPAAMTMQDCEAVDQKLDAVMCKNLFLCNAQRTNFYLLLMPARKKFKTKDLSKQIQSARLSFADAEHMEQYLNISPGAVSVMGLMNDRENRVKLLIDRELLDEEWFACHPCVNTSSLRMKLADMLEKFLPAVHHDFTCVELPDPEK
ncbi:MAG: prolyl-tRNA synthetase associated domain-containing protein [Eubacteriales bacterium]|nr:prolyl-tRNA synthetase associated domain-containing protein [Eubacteriales bacterium]